jgi:ribonuclease P protein component
MLPKAHRLVKRKDFQLLAQKGKPFYSPLFTLKIFKSAVDASQFGIVISAKVSKKAVVRNKIKRRLTEVIRKMDNLAKNKKVMILVKAAAVDKDFLVLKDELERLFRKAGLLL